MAKRINKKTKRYDDDAVRLPMKNLLKRDYHNYYLDRMEELSEPREYFEVEKVVEWEDVDEFCVFTGLLLALSFIFGLIGFTVGDGGWILGLILGVGLWVNMKLLLNNHRKIRWFARR